MNNEFPKPPADELTDIDNPDIQQKLIQNSESWLRGKEIEMKDLFLIGKLDKNSRGERGNNTVDPSPPMILVEAIKVELKALMDTMLNGSFQKKR
jgi:hypothetical protein